jgi:hypothetical protein
MTGGSFGYLYREDGADVIMEYKNMSALKEMYEWLRARGKEDAASELEKYYLDLVMFERMIETRQKRLAKIMKATEWWLSMDANEKDFDKDWQEFLEGKEKK